MAKKFIRILAVGLALIMCLAMAVPAFAEDPSAETGKTAGVVWFDKDLVMPKDATVPDVKFNFTLSTNTRGNGITVEGWEVHTGILNLKGESAGNLKTAYDVTFTATHPTTPGTTDNKVTDKASEKYATESFSIDFTGIDWPEPGIYRYMITETQGSDKGITYTNKVFYIDVYVVSDDDGNLSVGNTVVTEDDFLKPDPDKDGSDDTNNDDVVDNPELPKKEDGTKIDASGPNEPETPGEEPQEPGEGKKNPEDKVPGEEEPDPNDPDDNDGINKGSSQADFINKYAPLTLALSKTVKGNQGSRVAFFKFTVKLDVEDGIADGVYKIVGATGEGSDAYLIVREGTGTATVFLKHGQSISILVPYDTDYTITEAEDAANAAEYKTSTDSAAATWTSENWNSADNASKLGKTATGSDMAANATVAFVNFQEGAIPTGILMTVAPFAALMGVGLVGGAVVLKKKRED